MSKRVRLSDSFVLLLRKTYIDVPWCLQKVIPNRFETLLVCGSLEKFIYFGYNIKRVIVTEIKQDLMRAAQITSYAATKIRSYVRRVV